MALGVDDQLTRVQRPEAEGSEGPLCSGEDGPSFPGFRCLVVFASLTFS